jgi:thymidylate synthase
MKQYLDLLGKVLYEGVESEDRTCTGTYSIFGAMMEFDLKKGFPILTTKQLHFKSIATELLWFISGKESTAYLEENNNTIWREWCLDGYLHEGYGKQWRDFGGVDQLANVIDQIKTNPNSRRLIVSAWNPLTVDEATLPPCHVMFQFYVRNGELSCSFTMRSSDGFLGLPFNIASYALLTHLVAHVTGLKVGKLVYFGNDVHIYKNHVIQARQQLGRSPDIYKLPQLKIYGNFSSIDNFKWGDFGLECYEAYPSIKAEVAV